MDPGIQVRILAPQPRFFMPQPIAYLNGQFLPIEEARVPVEDRGFQFADGVYEVILVQRKKPFRLHDHLKRLQRSAEEVKIPLPLSLEEFERIVHEGIQRAGFESQLVYIQVTRGVAPREHLPPPNLQPTVVLTFRAFEPLPEALYAEGVALMTYPEIRWLRCDIKTVLLLPNVLAKMEAMEHGFFDALFVLDSGEITESTAAAFGVIRGDTVILPPLSPRILPSITRSLLYQVAPQAGLKVVEQPLYVRDLPQVEEAFLASTTKHVLPVVRVDRQQIGQGKPGPATRRLLEAFLDFLDRELRA